MLFTFGFKVSKEVERKTNVSLDITNHSWASTQALFRSEQSNLTPTVTQCCDDDKPGCADIPQEMLFKALGTYIWSLYHDVSAQSIHIRLLQPLNQIMVLHIWPI